MQTGFVFLPSFYEALKRLPDKSRHVLLDAMLAYVFEDETPELPLDLEAFWLLMQPNIESSLKRYRASIENGKKGGRPKKT